MSACVRACRDVRSLFPRMTRTEDEDEDEGRCLFPLRVSFEPNTVWDGMMVVVVICIVWVCVWHGMVWYGIESKTRFCNGTQRVHSRLGGLKLCSSHALTGPGLVG